MIKYNTVLFKDDVDHLYVGVKEDSKIVRFTRLHLSKSQEMGIRSSLVGLKLNEFLLVEIESDMTNKYGLHFKMTPFSCGTVSESDGDDTANLCEMDNAKLLQLFNDLIPEKILQD